MSLAILLDSGPLGLFVHPRRPQELVRRLDSWGRAGATLCVPEISYYEVRRELRRLDLVVSTNRLDAAAQSLAYLPITTAIIVRASELWADVRRAGRPSADAAALDGDVILAATAIELEGQFDEVVVVTTNLRHLEQLVRAVRWDEFSS